MRKKNSSGKKHTHIWIILLAVCCIGGTELAASYFFAPSLFAAVTTPVIEGASAAWTAIRETSDHVSQAISNLIDSWTAEPPLDAPIKETNASVSDPPTTQLKFENGRDILTGGVVDIEYFQQSALPWSELPYGTDSIGRYGCGPTTMAMVVNSLTDYHTDPMQMAQWAVDHHHWAKHSGSYLSLVNGVCRAFGLTVSPILERTPDSIQSTLLSGDLVVALMGPGHFTEGGHFIIIRGITLDGSLLVADPNSPARSLMAWDPQLIVDELSSSAHNGAPLWRISSSEGG